VKTSPNPDPATALDGRVRRGARSRQAIIAALWDLIGGGELQPTAQQVATRAGVGIRSVFRHFSEMESLYQAMDARLEAELRPLLGAPPAGGTIEERVDRLVRHRAAFYERVGPYKRSANTLRWRSRFLRDRHAFLQRSLQDDLRRRFPEVSETEVLEGLGVATCFEAWDRLRVDRQLSVKAAMAVLARTALALLRDRPRSGRAKG
jgi:AcrR family transcriptional regulator